MNWRLVRVMRRKGSENRYFVQRIPSDVKARAVGMTLALPIGDVVVSLKIKEATSAIRVSLKTASAAEAKARQAVLAAHVERVWQSLGSDVRKLTQKEAVALAGEVYHRFTAGLEDDPGAADIWKNAREANRAALAGLRWRSPAVEEAWKAGSVSPTLPALQPSAGWSRPSFNSRPLALWKAR